MFSQSGVLLFLFGVCGFCGFWLLLFGFLCDCCFPLLLACLSSFTDWCLVHRQQSRKQKKNMVLVYLFQDLWTLVTLSPSQPLSLCWPFSTACYLPGNVSESVLIGYHSSQHAFVSYALKAHRLEAFLKLGTFSLKFLAHFGHCSAHGIHAFAGLFHSVR